MKISVVIRAYNEEAHIGRLLLGITAQRQKPHEIILVDSGSTDRTVEIARRFDVRVVPIDKHEFTFGRALNRGCAAASGDVLLFASAHVYPVYDTWLEKLVVPFTDDRVALVYGRQVGNEVTKFSEHQIFARWFPALSTCPQRSYFCNNANCAVRLSKWTEQPYDETLTGLEDLAWAKAAQAAGNWIAYVADAPVAHVHDETWEQIQNRYRREAIAMRAIDPHAKFTAFDFLKLLQRNVLTDCRAAWRQGVLQENVTAIARFRYNQLLGTYRGYNDPPEVSAELKKRFYYPTRSGEPQPGEGVLEQHLIDYEALEAKAGLAGASPVGQKALEPRPGETVVPITTANRR